MHAVLGQRAASCGCFPERAELRVFGPLLGALLASSAGCHANAGISAPQSQAAPLRGSALVAPAQGGSIHARALAPDEAPDEAALKQMVGKATTGATVQLGNYQDVLMVDRIFSGLEAAGRVLTTGNGQSITWGFKYQEANLQSVVIADETGRLELAAVVDDVLRLSDGKSDTVTSVTEYKKKTEHYGLKPHIVVFARDRASLETAYPLLKRWLQANLLGFNTSCATHAAACALMPDLDLPTDAYIASGTGAALVKVAVPAVAAASVPLETFTQ